MSYSQTQSLGSHDDENETNLSIEVDDALHTIAGQRQNQQIDRQIGITNHRTVSEQALHDLADLDDAKVDSMIICKFLMKMMINHVGITVLLLLVFLGGFHLALNATSFSNEYEDLMVGKKNKCDHSQITLGTNRKIQTDVQTMFTTTYNIIHESKDPTIVIIPTETQINHGKTDEIQSIINDDSGLKMDQTSRFSDDDLPLKELARSEGYR